MDISVIIPTYNEENSISEIVKKVLRLNFNGLEKEVIIVDDGSSDRTPDILKEFSNSKGLKIVTHTKNIGKGAAIKTGMKNSTGAVIALQDSDLEYDPAYLPELVQEIMMGADVVYGSRFLGKVENMNPLFYLGNKFLSLATRILYKTTITDMETGYKIFKKEVVADMELVSNGFEIEPELTAKILKRGYKIKEIPINYRARRKLEKKITIKDGFKSFLALIKHRF
jgi:glycosyltransferase involved in cell wall biosynthesis